MALISLSDWLDRFGDAPPGSRSTAELDSVRLAASEAPAPAVDRRPEIAARAGWRDRLRRRWQRAFWRLKRLSSGHA